MAVYPHTCRQLYEVINHPASALRALKNGEEVSSCGSLRNEAVIEQLHVVCIACGAICIPFIQAPDHGQ